MQLFIKSLAENNIYYDVKKNNFLTGHCEEVKYELDSNKYRLKGKSSYCRSVGAEDSTERFITNLELEMYNVNYPFIRVKPLSFFKRFFFRKKVKIICRDYEDMLNEELVGLLKRLVMDKFWSIQLKGSSVFVKMNYVPVDVEEILVFFEKLHSLSPRWHDLCKGEQ